jgi:hypothetical protein
MEKVAILSKDDERLLASAPDLLEALRILVAAYQFGGLDHKLWLKAEAAINKAEGGL